VPRPWLAARYVPPDQIRGWVRQGRTYAWIGAPARVTVQQKIQPSRSRTIFAEGEGGDVAPADGIDEIDLFPEDDARMPPPRARRPISTSSSGTRSISFVAVGGATSPPSPSVQKIVLDLEGLDLLDRNLELVRDPRVGASLADPAPNLVQVGT